MKIAKVNTQLKKVFDLGGSLRRELNTWKPEGGLGLLALVEVVSATCLFIGLCFVSPDWSKVWGDYGYSGLPWGVYLTLVLIAQFLLSHGIGIFKKRRWALVMGGLFGVIALVGLLKVPMIGRGISWLELFQDIGMRAIFAFWMLDWIKTGWKAAFPKKAKSGDVAACA